MKYTKPGFTVAEVMFIVVLVVVIAFVGYRGWQATSEDKSSQGAPSQVVTPVRNDINSSEDVDKAITSLDEVEIEETDPELETQLNF